MFFGSKNKIVRRGQEREQAEEGRTKLSRRIFYFLLIIFFGVLAYLFLFSPLLEVQSISVRGTETISQKDISGIIQDYLGGKYFSLFPRNNLFLLRSGKVQEIVMDGFKKVRSVETEKVFPSGLIVTIGERKALLVWCSGACFLADERGVAYAPADFNSPEALQNNLIVIENGNGAPVPEDRPAVDPEYVNFILLFKEKAISELGLGIDRKFSTASPVSGDVTASTDEGWRILLSSELGAEKEIRMLKTALDQGVAAEKRQDLDYIDIRTEGKAYVRYKNTAPENEED